MVETSRYDSRELLELVRKLDPLKAGEVLREQLESIHERMAHASPEQKDVIRAERYLPDVVIPRLVIYYNRLRFTTAESNQIQHRRLRRKINRYLDRVQERNQQLYEALEESADNFGLTVLKALGRSS